MIRGGGDMERWGEEERGELIWGGGIREGGDEERGEVS